MSAAGCTAYVLLAFYAGLLSPGVFFRLFRFRNTPEYAFFYSIGCVVLAVSLLAIPLRWLGYTEDRP